jgi:hypothetical protein
MRTVRTAILLSIAATLFVVTTLAAPARAQEEKKSADATGTWKWTQQRQSGDPREFTLKLKQEGEKVTGTLLGFDQETPIKDGTVKNGEVKFSIVRTRNDQQVTSKYSGKIDGDTLKGTIETQFGDQTRSREWEAKRVKEQM